MQRRYTRQLGSSNVTQKINQNISKLFAVTKKLSPLTTNNLNKFHLWKEEAKGMATIVNLIYGSEEPQVYTTWIWNSLDEGLRGLCMNMDPILNPNMTLDDYLVELEKTLKPEGFYGLTRYIFETQEQYVTEPITSYWERVHICYNDARIRDPQRFKEVFMKGLANEEVMNRLIIKHPTDPLDCRKKASESVREVLEARRMNNLSLADGKAMAGLYTEALNVSNNLTAYVNHKPPKCSPFEIPEPMEVDALEVITFLWDEVELNMAEPLWGDGEGDQAVEEREDQVQFWEHPEQVSELKEGDKNACWSCGYTGHQRRSCPLRRKGDQGQKLALTLKKYDPERKKKNDEERRSQYNPAQRYRSSRTRSVNLPEIKPKGSQGEKTLVKKRF
jgi:hypothetical protein